MRRSSLTASVLVGFFALTFAGAAFAQTKVPGVPQVSPATPAGIFGMRGQIALSSDEGVTTSVSSTSGGGDNDKTLKFTLRPALDYFLIDNLSAGVTLGLDYTKVGDAHATVYSAGPRLGYNISFKSMFSVWPRAGVSYAARKQSSGFGPDEGESHVQLNVSVPLMFHPLTHFFVGFGPALDTDLSGDVKTTTLAGRITLGGWF